MAPGLRSIRMPFLLPAAVLLACVPAVTATQGTIILREGLTAVDIVLSLTVDGAQARDLRMAIDGFGDGDGQATHQEAENYGASLKATHGPPYIEAVQRSFTVDGAPPKAVVMLVYDFAHSDRFPVTEEGNDTSSEAPLEWIITMGAIFHGSANPTHEFRLGTGLGRDPGLANATIKMTIEAPPGRRLIQSSPSEGIEIAEGGAVAEFLDAPGGPTAVSFTVGPAGPRGSPSPALSLAGAAVCAAAWIVRERLQ